MGNTTTKLDNKLKSLNPDNLVVTDNMHAFFSSQQVEATITELTKQHQKYLKQFADIYPARQTYPSFKSYSSKYDSSLKSFASIEAYAMLYVKALRLCTEDIARKSEDYKVIMNLLKKANVADKEYVTDLQDSSSAADGMVADHQRVYNETLVGNIILFGGLSIVAYIFLSGNAINFPDIAHALKLKVAMIKK